MREIPQVGCEGFWSRTLSAALRMLSQNHCDGPTDQTQAISADAFEHWLVESDSQLFVLDASGAVIFRNPAAANLSAMHAPSTDSLSFGGLSGIRNKCKASNDKTATADLRALVDWGWIVQLHNIRMTDEPQSGLLS